MKIKRNKNFKFEDNTIKSFACDLKTDSFVTRLLKCKTNKKPTIAGPSSFIQNYNTKSIEGSLLIERDLKLKQNCVVILEKINLGKVREKYSISSNDCKILGLKKESLQPIVKMNTRKNLMNKKAKQSKSINFHIQSLNCNKDTNSSDKISLFHQNDEENSTSVRRSNRKNAWSSNSIKKQYIEHNLKNSLNKNNPRLQVRSGNKKFSPISIASKQSKECNAIKRNTNESNSTQNNRQLQDLCCKTTCRTPRNEKLVFSNLTSSPILRSNRQKAKLCDRKNNQYNADATENYSNFTRSSLKLKNICQNVQHQGENHLAYKLNFVDTELSKKNKLMSSRKTFQTTRKNSISPFHHLDKKSEKNMILRDHNSEKKENVTFCLLSEQGEIELEVIPADSVSINNFRLNRSKVQKSKKRINSSSKSLGSSTDSFDFSIEPLIPDQNRTHLRRQNHCVKKQKNALKFNTSIELHIEPHVNRSSSKSSIFDRTKNVLANAEVMPQWKFPSSTSKPIHVDENSPRIFNFNVNHCKDDNVQEQLQLSNHSLIEKHISYCSKETPYCLKKTTSPTSVCLLHIKTPERTILREVRHEKSDKSKTDGSILRGIKRGKDSPNTAVSKKVKHVNQRKLSNVKLKKEKCTTSNDTNLSISTSDNKSLSCRNISKVVLNAEDNGNSNAFDEIDLIISTKDVKPNFKLSRSSSTKKRNVSKEKVKRKPKAKTSMPKKKIHSHASSDPDTDDERNKTLSKGLFTNDSKQPSKGSMKRKQWFVDKLNKHSEGHEDDLFEEKKFDVEELLAEDSDSSELYQNMLTPKREFTLAPQDGKTANYEPCPSPVDLTVASRKNADEYLYRRNKRQKIKVAEEKQNPATETFEEKQTRLDVEKIIQEVNDLKKPKKKRRFSDFISEEDLQDYYFSDRSDDEISDFMND